MEDLTVFPVQLVKKINRFPERVYFHRFSNLDYLRFEESKNYKSLFSENTPPTYDHSHMGEFKLKNGTTMLVVETNHDDQRIKFLAFKSSDIRIADKFRNYRKSSSNALVDDLSDLIELTGDLTISSDTKFFH